jgi:hypothetical protein
MLALFGDVGNKGELLLLGELVGDFGEGGARFGWNLVAKLCIFDGDDRGNDGGDRRVVSGSGHPVS